MDLREYFFRERMSVTEFAKNLGYSRNHISGIMHGKLNASPRLAKEIEKATKGKVKAEELLKNKRE